jgi:ribosome maturation factor RimP
MAHFFVVWVAPEQGSWMDKEGLIRLLEPTVNALGYDLVDLDFRPGRSGLVRVFIDKEPAVGLSDCEVVSEQIGALLDVEDPIPSGYVLEVSSPGIDRRLRTADHFARVVGQEVRVELQRALQGRRRFRGSLTEAGEDEIVVEVDGVAWRLPIGDIGQARLVPKD